MSSPSKAKAPIFDLSHDDQVDLLAQALLREYMHRKKYKATLECFDQENPRNEKTVSQRSVMSDMMYLSAEVQSGLKARGIETIMEMLCAGRVEKRARDDKLRDLRDVIKLEVPTIPAELLQAQSSDQSQEAKKKKKNKDRKDGRGKEEDSEKPKKKKNKVKESGDGDDTAPGAAAVAEKKKKKAQRMMTIEDLLDLSDEDAPSKPKKKSAGNESVTATKAPPAQPVALAVADIPTAQRLSQSGQTASQPTAAAAAAADTSKEPEASDDSDDGDNDSDASDEEEDYASALRRIRKQEELEQEQHRQARHGASGVTEGGAVRSVGWDAPNAGEAAILEAGLEPPVKPTIAPKMMAPAPSLSSPSRGGPSVGLELAKAIKHCLVGGDRRIPSSFLQQGFVYSQHVGYGLVQHEGGPCGALAVVQAFALLSFARSKFTESADVQRAALITSLSSILLTAAGNDVRHVVVCDAVDPFPDKKSERNYSSDHIKVIAAMSTRSGFASRSALEDCLAAALEAGPSAGELLGWTCPEGPGLMCMLASLLMTRGGFGQGVRSSAELALNITRDMDLEGPLIVEHGYCSQELVNLMLQGRATSNVHDGTIVSGSSGDDSISLHGLFGLLEVGCLSFLEHRGLIKVGAAAKAPLSPVWVVYHESHYATLFMKTDVRTRASATGSPLPVFSSPPLFDLYFWDQQGQQDEEIRLTVTLDPAPLPAVPKGALVPYINDIIRTIPEWARARINWNGTDPLL
jgi:hypothetical protein